MTEEAPIIFCHYGNSKYLRYVFSCAELSNPDKKIFLLGDKKNQWLAKKHKNVEHRMFEDYANGRQIETFERVYKLVQGPKQRRNKHWVNFVFKRWFYIQNFISSENLGSFWHFDSDTMILDTLQKHESKYYPYDCTEQCNGSCLNGFITEPSIVSDYLEKINTLFEDAEYMQQQQDEFDLKNQKFVYTEMRAYEEFKKDGLNSTRLNTILDGSTFDDCICQTHGMEMEPLPNGRVIKKVYSADDGIFYCYHEGRKALTRMNTLNLSWVPIGLYTIILKHLKTFDPRHTHTPKKLRSMETLSEAYCRIHPIKSTIERKKRALKDKKNKPASA